jgi:heptaprenyl diphosphate synthase
MIAPASPFTPRTAARLGLLVGVATSLQIFENSIPKPLPWLRLGLANGVTLLVLVRLGWRAAFLVTIARVFLGGLLLGSLGAPTFLLSASGGLLAAFAMTSAARAMPPLSLLGVSVLGSAAHVSGQLAMLSVLFRLGGSVLALSPFLLASAVPLGLATGLVVAAVHRRLEPW